MKKIISLIVFLFIISSVGLSADGYDKEIELTGKAETEIVNFDYDSGNMNNELPGLIKKSERKNKGIFKRNRSKDISDDREKSWVAALVLAICLGWLGIHRFYLGYPLIGLLQLFTLGGFFVWWVIDIILVGTRVLKPKFGGYN